MRWVAVRVWEPAGAAGVDDAVVDADADVDMVVAIVVGNESGR